MTTHKHTVTGISLVENDIKSFQTPMEQEVGKCVKHFESELIKIRTGRAHTSLVEGIMVSIYGRPALSLKSLASLAAPDARLITIQPWDTATIPDIEKAIQQSEIGIVPTNDGKIIRLQLPIMSSQRRDELVKLLHKRAEESKVAIRNVRKEYNNLIRTAKADKKISENFYNRLVDVLQQVTDKFVGQIEQMTKNKEQELTSI